MVISIITIKRGNVLIKIYIKSRCILINKHVYTHIEFLFTIHSMILFLVLLARILKVPQHVVSHF